MFYRANINANILANARFRRQTELLAETNGHEDAPDMPSLSPACEIPSSYIAKIRFGWVREMGGENRMPETRILYFVAPIPACENARSVVDRASSVLPAAPPKEMPASLFLEDPFYSHMLAAAVPQATESLIDTVRPLLAVSRPPDDNLFAWPVHRDSRFHVTWGTSHRCSGLGR